MVLTWSSNHLLVVLISFYYVTGVRKQIINWMLKFFHDMFPTASEIGNHPSTFHKKVPLGLKLKDSRKKKENRVDLSISLTLPCISNLLKAHFFGSSSVLFLKTILGLSQFIRPSFIFSLSTSLFLLTTFNNFNFTETYCT